MLTTLATMAALAVMQQTDTTVPVRSGARLEVENFGGEIAVKTWAKNAVRIEASHSTRDRIVITASELHVRVKSEGRRGPAQVDYSITAPTWMALALSGVYTDINVDGAENEVTPESVQGEITVRGGSGNVSLKSVQGAVTLEKARGRIDLSSVNEEIKATDVSGDLSAETVNGDIRLIRIESANVDANTVNGDVTYDGTIKDGGRYRFATHDGSLYVAVPEKANVSIAVGTCNCGRRPGTGSASRSARAAPGSSSSHSTATSSCAVPGRCPRTNTTRTRTNTTRTRTTRRSDDACPNAGARRGRGRRDAADPRGECSGGVPLEGQDPRGPDDRDQGRERRRHRGGGCGRGRGHRREDRAPERSRRGEDRGRAAQRRRHHLRRVPERWAAGEHLRGGRSRAHGFA